MCFVCVHVLITEKILDNEDLSEEKIFELFNEANVSNKSMLSLTMKIDNFPGKLLAAIKLKGKCHMGNAV